MNPFPILALAVLWYAILEVVVGKLRQRGRLPNNVTFALGIGQSVGAFVLVIIAALRYFLH